MADKKISELTSADAAAGANEIPINEAGTTKKITVTQIAAAILPVKASKAEAAAGTDNAKFLTSLAAAELWKLPEGSLLNGKIVPSVASNNLTVALKGKDGNDPSATNPVYVMIGGTLRTITSALSKTLNAGANSFNAGSAELATKEIDYFVYIGYNATDGVVLGFSRIPFANQYSDFSATTTNEKYCAISTITNATATDYYNVIGRFAATLSAGAGYTWSVPTFTAINLIQRPIWETRILTWQPVYSATGSMTYTGVTTGLARYKLTGTNLKFSLHTTAGTTGGSAGNGILATIPFTGLGTAYNVIGSGLAYDAANNAGVAQYNSSNFNIIQVIKYNDANWGLGFARQISITCSLEI